MTHAASRIQVGRVLAAGSLALATRVKVVPIAGAAWLGSGWVARRKHQAIA